jgi:geranylgeranyl pyrophosphate synthase
MLYLAKNFAMHSVKQYQEFITDYLQSQQLVCQPENLYEPIQYILGLGGKRIRPVLTLMATEIFDTDYEKALPAALAVEVFHNFSLIHDDIMDDAPCAADTKPYTKMESQYRYSLRRRHADFGVPIL